MCVSEDEASTMKMLLNSPYMQLKAICQTADVEYPELVELIEKYQSSSIIQKDDYRVDVRKSADEEEKKQKNVFSFKDITDVIDLIDTVKSKRSECLLKLVQIGKYSYKYADVWEESFTGILDSVTECLDDESFSVKEQAISVISSYLQT